MKRTVGTLTLISYTNGFDCEVYDEDMEWSFRDFFAEILKQQQKKKFG